MPPASLTPTPDGLDDAEAVALLGNYQTMYFALAKRGALRPGETVLVLGSAGGVGTAAVQIAKALGAKVIAMVHRPQAHGVRAVAGRRRRAAADRRLAAGRAGTTPTAAASTSSSTPSAARPSTTRSGRWTPRAGCWCIGFAAGGIPTVKVNRLLLRNVSVVGVGYGEYVNRKPGSQAVFEFGVAQLVKAGLRPPPPMRYPLAEGCRGVAEPGRRGRARQGRAGAVMSACAKNIELWPPKALAFDVFGTVVDWRSSIIAELEEFGRTHGVDADWSAMADGWRSGYSPAMDRVRRGELPWTRIDDLHRMILDELLAAAGVTVGSPRTTSTISTARGTGSTRGRTASPDSPGSRSGSSSPRCRTGTSRC